MPPSTVKRVVLYRFDRPPTEAIVNPSEYLAESGVEIMTTTGNLQLAPYRDVKALCFAPEQGADNLFTVHNLFERRPKVPGLWARFTLRDGEKLDGILSHNLLDWPESGYLLTPPRASGTRQRVYLPRVSVSATELRGVVGLGPASRQPVRKLTLGQAQLRMFEG